MTRTTASAPKVSIITTTHNQEAFVRQTFDSFIAQQTEFPVEIIVADDASTDSTPSIIKEYANLYPGLFRPIFRPENVGLNRNLVGALSVARGEYIALCEGDDYWTDPLKLHKQVAFLDQHPDTAVCFHPVRVIWDDGYAKDSKFPPIHVRGNLSVDGLILMNFIQTNSVMYRRLSSYDDIPADVMPLDWHLHVRHAARGEIAMLPETMSVYRRHGQGMWHNQVRDPDKFWLTRGPGHAATFDAMLDVFSGDAARQELIAFMADWVLRHIARVRGRESQVVLQETIAAHPRFAMVALQHRWAPPGRRIRIQWRKLAAATPSRKGLVDIWPSCRRRQEATNEPDSRVSLSAHHTLDDEGRK